MIVNIRRLGVDDVEAFREIRLEAVKSHPDAFAGDYENEVARDSSRWKDKLAKTEFYGAECDGQLIGLIGYFRFEGRKMAHGGKIISMYVRPDFRGRQVGRTLIAYVVARARDEIEQLFLCCVTVNYAAYTLYQRMGFVTYGTEPRILKVGDTYYDEYLMVKDMRL